MTNISRKSSNQPYAARFKILIKTILKKLIGRSYEVGKLRKKSSLAIKMNHHLDYNQNALKNIEFITVEYQRITMAICKH